MRFRTRHLFYLTALVAINFALVAFWFSLQVPAYAGLIPLFLAAVVAVYCGWTHRPLLLATLFAAGTAALSSILIALHVILASNATEFLSTVANNTRFHADLTRNTVSIVVISVSSAVVGVTLAILVGFCESSLKRGRSSRVTCLAALGLALVVVVVWLSTFQRITDTNRERVRIGMSQPEVETILGPPNSLPDLTSKGEAFWDANTHLGRRYVAIHVSYDDEGRVESVEDHGFWNGLPWLYW